MAVADEAPVFFNPLDPGYVADPFPHLAELRRHDPVHHTLAGPWALFRYDDVFRLLRDPELSVDDSNADLTNSERAELFESALEGRDLEGLEDTSMLNTDPPDHTRLRRLVSKAFTPRSIDALRPLVQRLVDAALDEMEAAGEADLISGLAFPLPFEVITEMLGMPEGDQDRIRGWSEAMVKTLDPILTAEEIKAAFDASELMDAHIKEVIEWKRAHPGDDLLTRLIEAEEDGDRLSATEMRDQVVLLFIAGHETTVNLIGTGIYELLRHPDQLEQLRNDESLDANAIDELLRFVGPVQFSRRIATTDIAYGDKTIPKGSFVLAGLAAANRDPEQWGETADDLDLGRDGVGQHVSFGSGSHYCLGSALAKLEGQVAIGTFVRRFPKARIVGEPEWNGRINLRGLQRLVLTLG